MAGVIAVGVAVRVGGVVSLASLTATATVNENGTITYTATLTDANGNPVTAQNGPVTVTLDSGKTIT
ncbi:hypothetical protein B1218_33990, partial [Pseudomonas ogarae]